MTPADHANAVDFLLAHRGSDQPALFHLDQNCTHRQLTERVESTAAWLLAEGLRPGEVVALIGDNSIAWVVWYLAAMRAGGVALPLPGSESTRLLETAFAVPGLRFVYCQAKYADKITALLAHQPEVREMIEAAPGSLHCEAAIPPTWPAPEPAENRALILMTSGSTGDPKGVRLSHRNLQANARSIVTYLQLANDDRMMVVLPFSYCFGLSLLHTHLHAGGSLVLNNQFMFPGKVLADLAARRCTGLAGVPSTYQILLRKTALATTALPCLRHVQQAGGRLPAPLIQELRLALPTHARIFVMYGATEATSRLSYLPPDRLEEKLGSIGVPIPGVRIRVCDEDGLELPAGEVGELVADGDNIALGYLGEPEAHGRLRDGHFYTGDMGQVDGDGYLWLSARKADFIKTFGFRISPREVEDVISQLPEVLEVLVAGVPDDQAGEAVAAYVVLAPGSSLTADAIRQHCLGQLPNPKVPSLVELRGDLPKNHAGKLLRSKV